MSGSIRSWSQMMEATGDKPKGFGLLYNRTLIQEDIVSVNKE